jgi:uncharacterized RDD family membrane protein YckC
VNLRSLTRRSSGRAGTRLVVGRHTGGAPPNFVVRPLYVPIMSNATPFLATTSKRIAAAALDLVPLTFVWMVAVAIASDVGLPVLHVALLTPLTYIAYQAGFLYYWDGESPGRRVCNIRVVHADGARELGLPRCIARPIVRVLAIVLAGLLAQWIGQIALGLALAIDLIMISSLQLKQPLADVICRTLVVNAPPPQPHRAPAGPMYSALDAEFGPRPRRLR